MKVVTRLCWKNQQKIRALIGIIDSRGDNHGNLAPLVRTFGWFVCVINDCRTEECMEAAAFLAVISAPEFVCCARRRRFNVAESFLRGGGF